MPIKCAFCRRKYARAGPYEKHLRTAHANLDIVLASTVRYTNSDAETDLLHHEGQERLDSDYESEPEPTGRELDAYTDDIAHESDTKILGDSTSSLPARQEHFERAGDAIRDVNGFEREHHNLCNDPWAPFTSASSFKLASWLIQTKVSKSQINEYFSSGLGDLTTDDYCSMYTLENYLRFLDPHSAYLQWFEGQVEDSRRALPFFYRNVLDCVRYLLRQIAYRDDLVYAPRREYDHSGKRIYAEMHTADWWWDVQVRLPNLFYGSIC